jgi:hypothetical protein
MTDGPRETEPTEDDDESTEERAESRGGTPPQRVERAVNMPPERR